jgi:hypothetical protein
MQIRKLIQKSVACCMAGALLIGTLSGAEHRGVVRFGGLPVPGATLSPRRATKPLPPSPTTSATTRFPILKRDPGRFK